MTTHDLTFSKARPPTRVRYGVLATGCSLAVLAYLHRLGFALALPELNLSPEQASWLTAIFMLAYGGFEMPCGLLGDRFGSRHLIAVLVLGWSLMTGLVAVAALLTDSWLTPILFLLVVRFLFGMFQAGAFPLLARMLTDWMPARERASAQGTVWMASRGGGLVAPHVFAFLALILHSWQAALWVLAGMGVLWCAGFWPWFRNRPEELSTVNDGERALILAGRLPRAGGGHGKVPWARMLRSRSVWGLWLMYGCCGFSANFYITLLPTWLVRVRHLTRDETKWLSSLPFACGMLTCLLGGLLSDRIIRRTGNRRWGRRLVPLTGMALGSVGWVTINGVGTAPAAVPALGAVLCFIFLCNDLNMGPAWASCADVGEHYAGTIGGAMNMFSAFAGAGGNLLAGYLFKLGATDLIFLLYGYVYLIGALCWLMVDVTRPVEGVQG